MKPLWTLPKFCVFQTHVKEGKDLNADSVATNSSTSFLGAIFQSPPCEFTLIDLSTRQSEAFDQSFIEL